jgi:hypothetical protein
MWHIGQGRRGKLAWPRNGRGKLRVGLTDDSLRFFTQILNRFEKLTPMADRADSDILKIVPGQTGKDPSVDIVVAKCLRISLQTQ